MPEDKKEDKEEEKCSKAEKPEEEEKVVDKAVEEVEDDDDEEEDSEEEKKKKAKKKKKEAKKGEAGGENPAEAAASSSDANSSTSPGMGVPSTQNVFVPQTGISTGRDATSMGNPGSESYTGKSANTDLVKSPLFTGLSSQLNELQKAFDKKLEAVEKSMNDRISNLQKTMKAAEKFYDQSFYKAASENVNPESLKANTISKQIADGKVRYSN